jgi:hypothetical protein
MTRLAVAESGKRASKENCGTLIVPDRMGSLAGWAPAEWILVNDSGCNRADYECENQSKSS